MVVKKKKKNRGLARTGTERVVGNLISERLSLSCLVWSSAFVEVNSRRVLIHSVVSVSLVHQPQFSLFITQVNEQLDTRVRQLLMRDCLRITTVRGSSERSRGRIGAELGRSGGGVVTRQEKYRNWTDEMAVSALMDVTVLSVCNFWYEWVNTIGELGYLIHNSNKENLNFNAESRSPYFSSCFAWASLSVWAWVSAVCPYV